MRLPGLHSGSLGLVVVGAAATIVVAIYALTTPDTRSAALLLVFFGLYGTQRQLLAWRRIRGARLARPVR